MRMYSFGLMLSLSFWLAGSSLAAAVPAKSAYAQGTAKASASAKTPTKGGNKAHVATAKKALVAAQGLQRSAQAQAKALKKFRASAFAFIRRGKLKQRQTTGYSRRFNTLSKKAFAFIRRGKLKQRQTAGYKKALGEASKAIFAFTRRGKLKQRTTLGYRKAYGGQASQFFAFVRRGKIKQRTTLGYRVTYKRHTNALKKFLRRPDKTTNAGFQKLYSGWKRAHTNLANDLKVTAMFIRRGKIKKRTTLGYRVKMDTSGLALRKHNDGLKLHEWTHVLVSHSK